MKGSSALPRTPTRRAAGLTSVINSRLFAAASAAVADDPVTLPFGRARLLISPVAIGSPAIMTMGMSRVAFFAAWAAGVCTATMTSTRLRTSSAASPASRVFWPCADRTSIWIFLPAT